MPTQFNCHAIVKASSIAGLSLWMCFAVSAANPDNDATKRLQEVQQEIKKRQANLKERQAQQKRAQAELRSTELNLAKQAKELHTTRLSIEKNQQEQLGLKARRDDLESTRKAQQAVLAAQLESHFLAGSSDYLAMIFNQQDPASIERTLVYFQYLSEARIEALDVLKVTEAQLQQVEGELLAKHHQLEELLGQQSAERQMLKTEQMNHQQLISSINRHLKTEQESIGLLEDSENQLKSLLDKVAVVHSSVQLKGIKKGSLKWPTQGKLRHKYNSVRQGQIRWKGVLMAGSSGDDVRSIADGKVLFADWVKGMGLVMVLDHGKGYMSLYGHAQTLLRQPGDEVRRGDTIALVGQSGGQVRPGLYFEMRHEGVPVNPSHWCK